MLHSRRRELIDRYCGYFGASLETAEKIASGYAIVTDERQPVDDETLSDDIDEMREALRQDTLPILEN